MSTPIPRRTALRSAVAVLGVAAAASAAGCTASGDDDPTASGGSGRGADDGDSGRHAVRAQPAGTVGVVDPGSGDVAAWALLASRALIEHASTVVVASGHDADLEAGGAAARRLGVPLLVAGEGLADELDRLGTRTVLRYSSAADGATQGGATQGGATPSPGGSVSPTPVPSELGDREVLPGTGPDDLPEIPGLPLPTPEPGPVVLVVEGASVPPVVEPTLAAVGAQRVAVPGTDPRASDGSRDAVRRSPEASVLAVGAGFGSAERLAQRVRTARRATELPGGGVLPFPERRMVALYGHPETASLGMLGEQSPAESVRRAKALADEYAALTDTPVVPAFEIIATVASVSAQRDRSYSRRTPVETLLPLVEAAEEAGVYVVLDLQPGRTDFLTQARHYEELLRRPWVGLALDPEWRLKPNQKHLAQIGSVGVDEVNRVGAWLAALVREHDLPPKVLTLHQFRRSMIRGRERLDTSLDEVQWLVHADGQGDQGAKQATWAALRRDLPEGVWLGWKNFEDEDAPMLTPQQTMAQVSPTPWFVSYQ
ncbi:hypothetical protein GCM10023168_36640 [Fodinibacter luteus]|uniref:Lipoprotein n=1 Tax=Fodinibacter luteus TaxID=552064 RepID=A0ABP8KRV0_9MICO